MQKEVKQHPYEFILIRYGELALKGKNRKKFEQQLHEQIVLKLKGLNVKFQKSHGRMYLYLQDENVEEVIARLRHVFGISSFSPALKSGLAVEQIKETALQAIRGIAPQPQTFKVQVKRANKQFEMDSQQMNHEVGGHILKHTDHLQVDVHNPDVEVLVEIREDAAYIMSEKYQGAGGLPVGSSGRVMLMLSGGIDSPVAGYLSLKRGMRFEAVHFHSYPFTSERARQKVENLAQQLAPYAGHVKLHVVPFTEIQTQIRESIPEEYSITIMRRFMMRITEGLANKNKALAIVTGDNVGQVASQTLHSMHTINEVTNMPILRPLVTMDKVEIINIAKEIGTYETSILPYKDCCTVFQPKSPKTMPHREMANRFEERMDIEHLVQDAIERTEIETYTTQAEVNKQDEMESLF